MSLISIGIVGGHFRTARSLINSRNELEQTCCTKLRIVEITCTKESHYTTKRIKSKIANCSLVFLILSYGGHNINNIIWQLKRKASIPGDVVILPGSISTTGLIRKITAKIITLTNFIS